MATLLLKVKFVKQLLKFSTLETHGYDKSEIT